MRFTLNLRVRRRFSAGLLLVALLFRAYVPVGFMPAAGAPLLLQLCPEGMSSPMPSHHEHHQSSPGPHGHYEHCPFGSTPAGGPMSVVLAFQPPEPVSASVVMPPVPLSRAELPWPAHAPRGPPPNA